LILELLLEEEKFEELKIMQDVYHRKAGADTMDLTETIKLEIREKISESEKAWMIKLDCGVYWFPKSQCRIIGNKIYIPRWLAESKQIDYLDIDVE